MKNHYYSLILFLLFALTANSQTLTGIIPSQGTAGTTVTAIVTGQNTFFLTGSPQGIQNFQIYQWPCRYISGNNFVVLNNDSVQVHIPIPAGYVNGVYDVGLVSGTGQYLTLPAAFTITGGVNQSIQGFTPSSATEGTIINAQITGQNLQSVAALPGFNLKLVRGSSYLIPTNVTAVGPGQLNASFNIPAFSDTGYYDCIITVTNNCFTYHNALHVTGAYPKQLISISPSTGLAGSTLTALVTGQNTFFLNSSPQGFQYIKLENGNCNVYYGTAISVIDNDHLNVDFNFPFDASNGQYDLTVLFNSGHQYVLPQSFTITNGFDRSVTNFSPSIAAAGTTLAATIDGLGLADIVSHGPVTIKLTHALGYVINSTSHSMSGLQLLANFNIPPNAYSGFYGLDIITGTGCYKLNNAVQIAGGHPAGIVSITPSQGTQGQTLTALMTGSGTHFMIGTQTGNISNVIFSSVTRPFTFSVNSFNITFIDSQHVNLNISIPPNAPVGYYNVTVHYSSGGSLTLNPGFYVSGTNVSGFVYYDVDSNGIYNAGDYPLPNQRIETHPDNLITYTDPSGNYSIDVTPGLDTIQAIPDPGWINSSPALYILNIGLNDTTGINFGVRPLNINSYNVLLNQTSGFPGCNTDAYYVTTLRNNSTNTVDGTIWWLPDTNLTIISNNPPPSSVSGDTLFWNVTALPAQSTFTVQSVVHIPSTAGTTLRSFSCAEATVNGNIVASSCDSLIEVVSCNILANDKSVDPVGVYSQHYVLGTDFLTYQIRFQNTGSDTVVNISVFDTLNAAFDLSTFQFIASSHPVTIFFWGNVVEFRFDSIMLADSSVNEPMSHGFVTFTIKPIAGFSNGTIINNIAAIHFDMNSGEFTNVVRNTIVTQIPLAIRELTPGTKSLILYPNPTNGQLYFELPSHEFVKGTVVVIDQTGRVLKRTKIASDRGEIDLGNYPAGIYTIMLMNDEGIIRGRVIVY